MSRFYFLTARASWALLRGPSLVSSRLEHKQAGMQPRKEAAAALPHRVKRGPAPLARGLILRPTDLRRDRSNQTSFGPPLSATDAPPLSSSQVDSGNNSSRISVPVLE